MKQEGQLRKNEKGERWRMCELLERYWTDGIETGRREGRNEGRAEGMQALIAACKHLNAGFDVTMEELRG